jgi:Zn finger protein HypA/HybF involved in hydrogenase expression
MTSQTKKFIEISDVKAVQMKCKDCGAVLTLPIEKAINVSRLFVCPHCQRPWVRLPQGATAELAVKECIDAIRTMADILNGQQFDGFSLTLEIANEEKNAAGK